MAFTLAGCLNMHQPPIFRDVWMPSVCLSKDANATAVVEQHSLFSGEQKGVKGSRFIGLASFIFLCSWSGSKNTPCRFFPVELSIILMSIQD